MPFKALTFVFQENSASPGSSITQFLVDLFRQPFGSTTSQPDRSASMYEIGASPPGTFAVRFVSHAMVCLLNLNSNIAKFPGDSRCKDAVRPLSEGGMSADDEQLQPDARERDALAEASGQCPLLLQHLIARMSAAESVCFRTAHTRNWCHIVVSDVRHSAISASGSCFIWAMVTGQQPCHEPNGTHKPRRI